MTWEELQAFLSQNPTIQDAKSLAKKIGLKVKKRMKKSEILKLLEEFARSLKTDAKTAQMQTVTTPILRNLELPVSYESNRIVLLPVNPHLVFVYWDLSKETYSKLSNQSEVVLRLYDVTYINFDGSNAHRIFEAGIHLALTRNYYFHVPSSNADYLAELGFKAGGKFVPLLRSNVARTPSDTPSSSVRQRWYVKGKYAVKIGEPLLKPVERIHISSYVESGRK